MNPSSKLLVNTFCSSLGSTLLFVESTTIHRQYLWVITRRTNANGRATTEPAPGRNPRGRPRVNRVPRNYGPEPRIEGPEEEGGDE